MRRPSGSSTRWWKCSWSLPMPVLFVSWSMIRSRIHGLRNWFLAYPFPGTISTTVVPDSKIISFCANLMSRLWKVSGTYLKMDSLRSSKNHWSSTTSAVMWGFGFSVQSPGTSSVSGTGSTTQERMFLFKGRTLSKYDFWITSNCRRAQ